MAARGATKSKATGQAGRIKREQEGKEAAEEFIEDAKAKAKRRSTKDGWPCTAEDLTRERDERGLSWKQVAVNLNLGSPGQARKAYTELTGKPHNESNPIVNRAPRGSGTGTAKLLTPLWDDDSDQDEIIDKIQGPWVDPVGEPGQKNYTPGHYRGSVITIRRPSLYGGPTYEETMRVNRLEKFVFDGKDEDGPLVMHMHTDTGWRCFRVTDVVAVR